ncbi:MAG TPA: transcriptional repressor [Longimicrobiaceae bacterium]|nr:transcriptional repressor [Longimicrobiaceae bacterium]
MSTVSRNVPSDADAVLRGALEASGQRYTDQRAAVYRFLCQSLEHPTADEVFTAVRTQITDISLATVYKALETLVSCELAIKLTYGDGSARYDARTDDHCHSRCLGCGIVRDIADQRVPELPTIEVGDGFEPQGYRVEVVGYCRDCASA